MSRHYLDTTALFERWTGETRAREVVKAALGSEKHATSSHVLREWVRLVEGTTAEVLNVVGDGEQDLGEIFARLSQGWGREAGQRLRVLGMLASGRSTVSATELDLRARQILRSGSQEMFMHHVDEVRDGSECGLARNEVKMSGGRFVLVERCKRSDQICRQDRFIAQHLEEWEGASRGLISHATRKNDREMGGLGMKIAANPPFGKGKNCYARSGDISISCECAAEETLLTTDASFEAIAKERGLNVKRFEGTAPP